MASNITAQSVLADISRDHLECPICSERFKRPKLLECSHSFCLECLQQLGQNSPSSTKLSCPVCRKETILKAIGVDDLTTDYKIISMVEAIENQETQLKKQQGKQETSGDFVSKCSKHNDKDLVLYCETCKKLICTACITKDHKMHPAIELNEALDKGQQHATELLAIVAQSIQFFTIAIQEIHTSRKILDSMFAATKEKISKKADEEIAKEVARIKKEKQDLMQEAEQIYKDRVKTMETAHASNNNVKNKAELKQEEVFQLMDQRIKIIQNIEQLLQDLKVYREMKSTEVPDGFSYMDLKEGQKSLGRLVLKDEHFKQNKWTLKSEIFKYQNKNQQRLNISPRDVTAFSHGYIVLLDKNSPCLFTVTGENIPQSTFILQPHFIGVTQPISVTVNKNDELITLNNGAVKIFTRNYQLIHQFKPNSEPSCIAVDDNNLIAVGYRGKKEISVHKPDGSLIRSLSAPGICEYLTTYKQGLIYLKRNNLFECYRLVSIDYNGAVVFSIDVEQPGIPQGVCCDKKGRIYIVVWTRQTLADIHKYSPDGRYVGCIIKDCVKPSCMTITPAGDLVVAADSSLQIYQHE